MKILFDQGVPLPLRKFLIKHTVVTAYEKGWSELQNGALLAAVQAEFELFVTTDKNLRYQQNFSGRTIAIAVLSTPQWPVLLADIGAVVAQIDAINAGEFFEVLCAPKDPGI